MNDEQKPPGLLLTLLTGKKADLEMVRRRIGHRRLVLLAHPGTEPFAQQVQKRDGPDDVAVEPLPTGDVQTQLKRLRTVTVRQANRDRNTNRIVLQAAGGDPALVMAMILFAYEQGHETWFTQEGHHVKLPILSGIQMQNRLERPEEEVLKSLPGEGITSSELAQRIILPRSRVESAYRSLEKKDLVALYTVDGRVAAQPTATGRYLQHHLESGGATNGPQP